MFISFVSPFAEAQRELEREYQELSAGAREGRFMC